MRGKLSITIVLVAAVAALGGVLVAVAGADGTTALPDVSAPELLARMGDHSRAPQAISGDISWTNDLFGDLSVAPEHAGQPAASPLTTSGSGRLWAQDEKVRLESQGSGGDQVLVADGEAGTVWTYTFADDTARLYQWAGDETAESDETAGAGTPAGEEPLAHASPQALAPDRVSAFLEATARFMSVEVTGQSVVAGRDAYLLTMTPAADDTALGKVEAAIDGETYVPLRVEVVAEGHDTATISFGFTRVSYDPIEDDVFAFSPPDGATVERETIDPQADGHGEGTDDVTDGAEDDATEGSRDGVAPSEAERADAMEQMKELARTALLSRDEAAELVDFPLAWARDYTARDFRWVYVFDKGMPVNALGSPVFDMAQMFGTVVANGEDETSGGDAAGDSPPVTGPAAVLLYGEGFGSIVLAETKTTSEIHDQLEQLPEIVDSIDLGGAQAKAVVTPLGSVVVWERDGVTFVVGGMVPKADLVEFVTAVR